MKIITVEGNIACGKTTFLEKLQNKEETLGYNIQTLIEPLNEWKEAFENYEKTPKKYGWALQKTIQESLALREGKIDESKDLIFTERSIESSNKVFYPLFLEKGFIPRDKIIEKEGYDKLVAPKIRTRHFIIYINTPAISCMKRIQKRKQLGDSLVNLEYLLEIENKYENWLKDKEEVIKVPGDQTINLKGLLEKIMRK